MKITREAPAKLPPINRVEVNCMYRPKDTLTLDHVYNTEDGPKQCRISVNIGSGNYAIVMPKADALEFAAALNEIFG